MMRKADTRCPGAGSGCCALTLVTLSFVLLSCGEDYVPLRAPQKSDCTIGLAMGNATPDGRPICWKNRDWSDGNNRLFYNTSGTYAYIGIGASTSMMGLNEMGMSAGNSVVWNLDDMGDNVATMHWALQNAATVEEVRQAVIDETEGYDNHWSGRGASGCFPFMDAEGNASMFEIGGYYYYEYDPTNPNRLAQFPMQVVARANDAHRNSDHTDDGSTGGSRYTTARDMLIERAESGGVTIEEFMQVARRGEPEGVHLISNYMTLAAQLNHGVKAGEDPRIATMWASVGQPDYCIWIPVWVAAGDSLSDRLTSRDDTTGLAGRSWEIYDGMDNSDYDDYVNDLYSAFQANLYLAGDMVRQHWFANGFDVDQADALSDEAAETAWTIMNSMANGSGRNLNEPPELTALDIQPVGGTTYSFSRTASDPDGSLVGTDWDFGDGTGDTGDTVTHEYQQAGTFLVRCRVEDDEGARNSRWAYQEVVPPYCGDGMVSQDETCDPGAPANDNCCDPETCQWIASGEIDPQGVCSGAPECQLDVCNGTGACLQVNVADGSACTSDGLFCSGTEQCSSGTCQSTGDPCSASECNGCDEAADSCFDPLGTPCTDDGLFCTGAETCDGAGNCVSGGDPCPGTDCNNCSEVADNCFDAIGTPCSDDGLFCTGVEQCDGLGTCASSGDPCTGQTTCDEGQDACLGCNTDADCPLCQWCDAGVCQNQGAGSDLKEDCPEAACHTGTCDGSGACGLVAAGTSCTDGDVCNGEETCDSLGVCQSGQQLACDDGQFCNGVESCDPVQGCLAGADPCDDQDNCTIDSCDEEADTCAHDQDPACSSTDGGNGTDTDNGEVAGGCSCASGTGSTGRPLHLLLLLTGLVLAGLSGRKRRRS